MNGIFLSTSTLKHLSPEVRAAVLEAAGLASAAGISIEEDDTHLEGLARFNERQVRQLLKRPLSPTSKKILQVVAELEPRFRLGDALKKLKMPYSDLRYALAGLTKRTRHIANDDEIDLFGTVEEAENENDWISEMHPETHAALRRALKTAEGDDDN